jgi:hypothetical protein
LFGIRHCRFVVFSDCTRRAHVADFIFLKSTTLAPGIDLGPVGINRTLLFVKVAADRQLLSLFPALNRADIALEIGGDFLP